MAKYASCSRAHCSQKGTPQISVTARCGQGCSVLLRTWHGPSFFVAAPIKMTSCSWCGPAYSLASVVRSTIANDVAETVSLRHLLSLSTLGISYTNYKIIIARYCRQDRSMQRSAPRRPPKVKVRDHVGRRPSPSMWLPVGIPAGLRPGNLLCLNPPSLGRAGILAPRASNILPERFLRLRVTKAQEERRINLAPLDSAGPQGLPRISSSPLFVILYSSHEGFG